MHPVMHDRPDRGGAAPVAVMDGACLLCCAGARLIARFDRSGAIRICPARSPLGEALMRHHGLDPEDPESWLYLEDGVPYTALDAVLRIAARAGPAGMLLTPLRLLPRGTRDWLYRRIARNRGLLGRGEICAITDADLRRRLIG